MNTDHLGRMLTALAERNRTPGAQVALCVGGAALFAETGVERFGAAAPVTRASTFPYGSVTKSFTATVLMRLAAEGDLDLDEPIGAVIPELAGASKRFDKMVTPRHLLSHTSGLPCDFPENGAAPASFRRHALAARALEPIQPPGVAFSYSNAGFVLCGLMVEDVTGLSWWDAVESLVLDPMGVEPAFCADPRNPPRRGPSVSGHSVSLKLDRTIPVEPLCAVFDAPAGGLAGSAADLLAFGRMHLADPELRRMRTGAGEVTPFGLAAGWGLGLARFRAGDVDWFGHDGTTDGTTCNLRFEPDSGVVLAMTTNAGNGLRLWEELLAELREAGLDVGNYPAPTVTARPAAEVPDCAGEYLNGDVIYAVARGGDGLLTLDLDDGLPRHLTFYEGLLFSAEDPTGTELPVAGRFVRGGDSIRLMEIGGRVVRRKARV
ncbi:MAG TPA: serine hydrolase domain-containing protein [Actinophytocola sp.]|jgi:CubicO group peptidase (beta-lactamase class C family)|uniref:serine hydrolase domain-containing protein n=1 Tax=Actinophytocola sp. TaxID=1872138 RepID=UPI002E0CC98B|nr:serine hydrolase domain-containing protein [Actinophytocola sp.]